MKSAHALYLLIAFLTTAIVGTAALALGRISDGDPYGALAAWSEYAAALAPVAALIAALFAALSVRDQMNQTETHHQAQLKLLRDTHEAQMLEAKRSREAACRPVAISSLVGRGFRGRSAVPDGRR